MQRITRIGEFELDAEPLVCTDGRFAARVHVRRISDGHRMTSREFPSLDEFASYGEALEAGMAAGREIVHELQARTARRSN